MFELHCDLGSISRIVRTVSEHYRQSNTTVAYVITLHVRVKNDIECFSHSLVLGCNSFMFFY